MSDLPRGTVTFLMTDVEGSTNLWHQFGPAMDRELSRLDDDVHRLVAHHEGVVIKSRGEGDSHFAVFDRASPAIYAAVELQRARADLSWPRVRAALHTGEAEPCGGDYRGALVNRTARLRSAAHGGQIVCSRLVADLAEGIESVELRSLGTHRIRDVVAPTELFQVCAAGIPADFPPLATVDATASTVMTVVIADRVGSSRDAQLEGRPPADWQGPLFRALRSAANERDGRFLKLLGDGCLVAFEDPRAALSFAKAVCEEQTLGVRAAVAAGVVEVLEGELTGPPVWEAAQRVKLVESGTVWVAPVVHALTGRATRVPAEYPPSDLNREPAD